MVTIPEKCVYNNIMEEKESKGDYGQVARKTKSELYHIWKNARKMYDMVDDDDSLEAWMKDKVRLAYDYLDEAIRYLEYDEVFPAKEGEPEGDGENNFLSNQDKRYPTPMDAESGDQFMTRCIYDPNMKQRYSEQSDRFAACMIIYNESIKKPLTDQPGEKFDDPMASKEPELPEPNQPVLP